MPLTTNQVAEKLGITPLQLEKLHYNGCPRPTRVGRQRVYSERDLVRVEDALSRSRMLKTEQVIKLLGIDRNDIYALERMGMDLPKQRYGRVKVWSAPEIEELRGWLRRREEMRLMKV